MRINRKVKLMYSAILSLLLLLFQTVSFAQGLPVQDTIKASNQIYSGPSQIHTVLAKSTGADSATPATTTISSATAYGPDQGTAMNNSLNAALGVNVSNQTGELSCSLPIYTINSYYGLGPSLSLSLEYSSIPDVYMGTNNSHSDSQTCSQWALNLPFISESTDGYHENTWVLTFGGNQYTFIGDPTDGGAIKFAYANYLSNEFTVSYNSSTETFTIITKDGTTYVLQSGSFSVTGIEKIYRMDYIQSNKGLALNFVYDSDGELTQIVDGNTLLFGIEYSPVPTDSTAPTTVNFYALAAGSTTPVDSTQSNAVSELTEMSSATFTYPTLKYGALSGDVTPTLQSYTQYMVGPSGDSEYDNTFSFNYTDIEETPFTLNTGENNHEDQYMLSKITYPSGVYDSFGYTTLYGYGTCYGISLGCDPIFGGVAQACNSQSEYLPDNTLVNQTTYTYGSGNSNGVSTTSSSQNNFMQMQYPAIVYQNNGVGEQGFDAYLATMPVSMNQTYQVGVTKSVDNISYTLENTYDYAGNNILETTVANGNTLNEVSYSYPDSGSSIVSGGDLVSYYNQPLTKSGTVYAADGVNEYTSFVGKGALAGSEGSRTLNTAYQYDNYGNLKSTTNPDGSVETLTYAGVNPSTGMEDFVTSDTLTPVDYPKTDSTYTASVPSTWTSPDGACSYRYASSITTGYNGDNSTKVTKVTLLPTSGTATMLQGQPKDMTDSSGSIFGSSDVLTNGITTNYAIANNTLTVSTYTHGTSASCPSVRTVSGSSVTYDLQGNPIQIVDKYGNTTSYVYEGDCSLNLASVTFQSKGGAPQTTTYTWGYPDNALYDNGGYLDSKTSPPSSSSGSTKGYEVVYAYNALGQLIGVYDSESALGTPTKYTLPQYTEQSSYVYNLDSGMLASETDYSNTAPKLNASNTTVYGATTTYAYDMFNRELAEVDDLGMITGKLYDDCNGEVITYTLESNGSPYGNVDVSLTNVIGETEANYVLSWSELTTEVSGIETDLQAAYKADGALNKGTVDENLYLDLGSNSVDSDFFNAISKCITANEFINRSTYTYDGLERVKSESDSFYVPGLIYGENLQTNKKSYTYSDLLGVESVTDPSENVTSKIYNMLGETTKEQINVDNPNGLFIPISQTYDGLGELNSSTNEEGHTTTYSYSNGDISGCSLPDGTGTEYRYYPDGELKSTTDLNGTTLESIAYYPDNSVQSVTDYTPVQTPFTTFSGSKAVVNGEDTESYTYNNDGSIATKTSNILQYDPASDANTDNTVNYAYSYDNYGALTTEMLTTKYGKFNNIPVTNTLTYTYDESSDQNGGNAIAVTSSLGGSETSYLDSLTGNVDQTQFSGGDTINYQYDNLGEVKGITYRKPNDLSASVGVFYTYNGIGQITTKKDTVTPLEGTADQYTDEVYKYTYDNTTGALDNVALTYSNNAPYFPKDSHGNEINNQTFTYDSIGDMLTQKTVTTAGTNTLTYTYDKTIPTQLASLKSTDTTVKFTTPVYDDNGDMTTDYNGNVYTYNVLGHMTSITSAAGISTYYAYNSDENTSDEYTVSQDEYGAINDVTDKSTYYDTDGSISGTMDNSDNTNPTFITPAGYTQLTPISGSDNVYYQVADAQGSDILDLQWQGATLNGNYNAYTPYGAETSYGLNSTLVTPGNLNISYLGEQKDSATGYMNLGNGVRQYDPTTGRFIGFDSDSPIGPGGLNGYAYCNDDPVNGSDYSGHEDSDDEAEDEVAIATTGDPEAKTSNVGEIEGGAKPGSDSIEDEVAADTPMVSGGEEEDEGEEEHSPESCSRCGGSSSHGASHEEMASASSRPGGARLTSEDFNPDGSIRNPEALQWLQDNGFVTGNIETTMKVASVASNAIGMFGPELFILKNIASGKQGVVYQGIDCDGNEVAIKIPHVAKDSPNAPEDKWAVSDQDMFDEADAWNATQTDFGRSDLATAYAGFSRLTLDGLTFSETPGLVMPFIRGKTVKQFMDENGITDPKNLPKDLIRTYLKLKTSQIGTGGTTTYINRDVHVGNVIIEENTGNLISIDFGLAIRR